VIDARFDHSLPKSIGFLAQGDRSLKFKVSGFPCFRKGTFTCESEKFTQVHGMLLLTMRILSATCSELGRFLLSIALRIR
jgi:hypothetical protein